MPRESMQRRLERARPPRVRIAFETRSGGAVSEQELPFVIGVMGAFAGEREGRPRWSDRRFIEVTPDNFDEVIAALEPRLVLRIPHGASGELLSLDLRFTCLEDFEPEGIARRVAASSLLPEPQTETERAARRRLLDRILHAPEFQALEASWRGLRFLVLQAETSEMLPIRLIDVSKTELLRDLERASEPDQSVLFKRVYEEVFGVDHFSPFGLLIGDFEFSSSARDVELLEGISFVAEACMAPFIAAAAPGMFNLDSFAELDVPRDLSRVFESTEKARWKSFRASESARYVVLTVPRILLRSPYGMRPGDVPTTQHDEAIVATRDLLWGNAAYALGVCIANAFARYGWCAAIRGVESGGIVEGLPKWSPGDEDGRGSGCTEAPVTARREYELARAGFTTLVQDKAGSDQAVFFSVMTCAQPRTYDSDAASSSARMACQLPFVLTAARFGHYVKVIAREYRSDIASRGEWEAMLNSWLSRYVMTDDQASPAMRARYPLRQANIEVREEHGKPGCYQAIVYLRPHFQLDELPLSMRLVMALT